MSPLGTSNNWNHAVFVCWCLLTSLSLTVICGEVALHSFRGGLAYFYLLYRMLTPKVSGMDLIFSFHSLAGFPRSPGTENPRDQLYCWYGARERHLSLQKCSPKGLEFQPCSQRSLEEWKHLKCDTRCCPLGPTHPLSSPAPL